MEPAQKQEVVTRDQLVDILRQELMQRAGGEFSICAVAAQSGIFCNGFRRFTDRELRKRFGWIAKRYPEASRQELEQIADLWQVARQEITGLPTACDVQQQEHDSCNGWDDFSAEELSQFAFDLTGRKLTVT